LSVYELPKIGHLQLLSAAIYRKLMMAGIGDHCHRDCPTQVQVKTRLGASTPNTPSLVALVASFGRSTSGVSSRA
jgi:hypothetical protein